MNRLRDHRREREWGQTIWLGEGCQLGLRIRARFVLKRECSAGVQKLVWVEFILASYLKVERP